MTLLVRTPKPYLTESLLGFVLRVAEANGYESPRYVWELAHVPRGAEMAPRLPIDGLARVLGQVPQNLQPIAYRATSEGRGSFKILDHPLGNDLRGSPLRLRNPALFPPCVAEQEHIDAFWDLGVAVACPIHRSAALGACPACGSPLSWVRPALLACHCGASLATATLERADDTVCELMEYVRARLQGAPINSECSASGLPMEFFASMPFSALIRMIAALGAQGLEVRHPEARPTMTPVAEAASILADWPHGYHRFLSKLGEKVVSKQPELVGLRKQFNGFYSSMFQNRVFSTHAAFLREEFLRFGQQHWGNATVDRKFFAGRGAATLGRFMSKNEVARRFRIWKPVMERMIADGSIMTKQIGRGRSSRIVVDLEKSRLPHQSAGLVTVRQASAQLGLPVSVLRDLRRSGIFVASPRRGRSDSWHRDDVEAFRARSLLLPGANAGDPGCSIVRLDTLMLLKLRDARAKADIVAAVFDGRLTIRGRENDYPGGLILDRLQVDEFLLCKRREVEGATYSLPQCAKVTGLDPSTVANAIQMGLLTSQNRKGRTRVTSASVNRFRAQYVPLSVLARKLGSSAPCLLRKCRSQGLSVIMVPRADNSARQPLLRRADEKRLVELWDSELRDRAARRASTAPPCLERLRQYLERLRAAGQRLPRRAGRPNLVEIARACGMARNAPYVNPVAAQVLQEFDERERVSSPLKDPVELLRTYLERLRENNTPLPRWGGRPNKLAIARACGIERGVFYDSPEALQLLSAYTASERPNRGLTVTISSCNWLQP